MTTCKQTFAALAFCLAAFVPQASFANWTAAGSTASIDEADTSQFGKSGDRLFVKSSAGTVVGRFTVNPIDVDASILSPPGYGVADYFLKARYHDGGSRDKVYLKLLRSRVDAPGGLETLVTMSSDWDDGGKRDSKGWQTRWVAFRHAFEPGWAYFVEAWVTKSSGGNPILVAVEIGSLVD